ncbi:MAG: hypothetical protein JWO66_1686 [Candidatus Eremiobacteraeota bacterium]|nr:hypothetical protein [Candidatus Eremiobacteraeota bacterium]
MIVPLLLAIDFTNFTYATNPCASNVPVPAVMRHGSFSYEDKKTGSGFDVYVRSVKKGSLRSGTRQAVVVLACGFPIGGTAAAYLFDERGDAAVLLAQVATANWGADWGRGPDSIHVREALRAEARYSIDGRTVKIKSSSAAKRPSSATAGGSR